jgi:hypothetical protein
VFYFPRFSSTRIHAGYCAGHGDVQEVTPHKIQRIMVDLGYFEQEAIMQEYTVGLGEVTFLKDIIVGKLRPVYRFTCVKPPPDWYNMVLEYDIVPYVSFATY